ncbi:MAG: EAL domain-containing protein [Clostridiales bacterium]|nr:EAL domain-containing protein [Clostridiales bacterium]
MKVLSINRNSLIVRLLFPILAVLIFQAIIFSGSIMYGGTIEEIREISFNKFNEQVLSRKNYLQRETQRTANLLKFEHDIQSELDSFLDSNQMDFSELTGDPQLVTELLENTVDHAISVLRQNTVTGAFIVFTQNNGDEYSGIYVRDLDPLLNPNDNSDIIMERGPSDVALKANISLGKSWLPSFDLTEEQDFVNSIYKPMVAAYKNKKTIIEDLGYWSRPYKLGIYDVEAISYSIPLRDKDGEPYGVIGIDLTLDYLRKLLNYDELADNKQAAYLLAIGDKAGLRFENVLINGPMFKGVLDIGGQTVFDEGPEYQDIYVMQEDGEEDATVYGSIHYLNLYNPNTLFEEDRWALVGVIKDTSLFDSVSRIKTNILISVLISLGVGVLGAVFTGLGFVKPIFTLASRLRDSDPEKTITLGRTRVKEIDDLALAVESLSSQVAESASRLSKIIGMVNIPIAAFEHDLNENRVFCTESFFKITGVENTHYQDNYISSTFFYELLKKIKRNPEHDLDDVYRYEDSDGSIRWIRIKIQEEKGKVLGVIEDATEEIRDKRKIEYERDHDMLTHLVNRRAFHTQTTRLMKQEDVGIAAYIMWDLDNLKYTNDTYGHDYGDEYIRTAAGILREINVYNGIIGRISGDEFHAFIYGYDDKEEIRSIVRALQKKLYNTTISMPDGTLFRIRASVGMAWYPDDSKNYYELVRFSDFAMYETKNNVKGSIGEFNLDNYTKDSFLLDSRAELNRFIDEELVEYVFQPIVDAREGSVFAYEALMRPQLKALKSPRDIIKLAQSQSKLYEIERITWFKSMDIFTNNIEDFGDAKLFVNSIPNHVLSNKDLNQLQHKYGEYLHRVVVEITENEQANEEITSKKKEMIMSWGSQLALDDFGSGYSNDIALLILTPAFIKIDMTIIRGIDKDLNRQKLLLNLLSYAKDRHIKVIAEGVERKAEMDKLIEYGIDYLQGYYIGKPHAIPQQTSPEVAREIRQTWKEKRG